jgi:hypothetical protein
MKVRSEAWLAPIFSCCVVRHSPVVFFYTRPHLLAVFSYSIIAFRIFVGSDCSLLAILHAPCFSVQLFLFSFKPVICYHRAVDSIYSRCTPSP